MILPSECYNMYMNLSLLSSPFIHSKLLKKYMNFFLYILVSQLKKTTFISYQEFFSFRFIFFKTTLAHECFSLCYIYIQTFVDRFLGYVNFKFKLLLRHQEKVSDYILQFLYRRDWIECKKYFFYFYSSSNFNFLVMHEYTHEIKQTSTEKI